MRTIHSLTLAAALLVVSAGVPALGADEDPLNPKTEVINKPTPAEPSALEEAKTEEAEENPGHHSALGHVLLFLPNRFLDLLDVVRARVRVGPGIGAGVRATEFVEANLASYATLYAGFPGPRGRRMPRSPIGAELYAGACISVLKAETESFGPHYSSTEFGAGFHFLLLGLDVGIDPYEAVDFLSGLFFLDPVDDDL